jgi:hypothetical protein
VEGLIQKGIYDYAYIAFVRHVAFRIYLYTNRPEAETNWFAAERLLGASEWLDAITAMAKSLHNQQTDTVRSENIRAYYSEQS